MSLRVLHGSPCNAWIAPYYAIICNDAKALITSIYRGDDAATILHKYGKHTQRELYETYLHGQGNPANPPGFSSHELRSDGAAYPHISRGMKLAWWQQGIDVNDGDVEAVIRQASWHKWELFQPYPNGSEFHHLNFRRRPRPTVQTLPRIIRLRATLPRS